MTCGEHVSNSKAMLLRLGYKYSGKSSWTSAHERYLREVVLPHPAHKVALEDYLGAIQLAKERVDRLTGQIEVIARDWRLWPAVQALLTMRGFQVLSAVILLSELGDLARFSHPRKLMAYLGLIPSEYSSSEKVRKGRLTKCGNAHARWILVEAAQHYRKSPKVSKELSKRQEGQPRRILQISWTAQNRLYRRIRNLIARGKRSQVALSAAARELGGFVWAIMSEWRQPGSIPVQRQSTTCVERPLRRYSLKSDPGSAALAKANAGYNFSDRGTPEEAEGNGGDWEWASRFPEPLLQGEQLIALHPSLSSNQRLSIAPGGVPGEFISEDEQATPVNSRLSLFGSVDCPRQRRTPEPRPRIKTHPAYEYK
jgi:hypothetical protein